MSLDKNEGLLDYEMIYGPDNNDQKILYEIKEENNVFEMIYKPNDNKNEKIKKLEKFKKFNNSHFEDDKEYSGDVIRILDRYFIKNNKNKGKLIYNNKKYELKEYFEEIENNYENKDIIKLKLYGINNIFDMSRMFYGCYHLTSFSEINIQQNTNDFNDIFYEHSSFIALKEYIKSNYSNLKEDIACGLIFDLNKEYIESTFLLSPIHNNTTDSFSIYNSFEINIEISPLKRNKILKTEKMFYECFSLISISDTSNWNTCNVTDMSHMFYECNSLISLPDISKWNTSNVSNMSYMFSGCNSLISFPNISKWNTSNVSNKYDIFSVYNSLISLSDISKWYTSNVRNMADMFSGCNSLISLLAMSKLKTSKFNIMNEYFKHA